MDASIKIPEEDLVLINEFKNELLKRKVKISQKDIVDKSIKFSLKRKKEFLSEVVNLASKHDNTKESTKRFLEGEKFDFGKNWTSEIDTTL